MAAAVSATPEQLDGSQGCVIVGPGVRTVIIIMVRDQLLLLRVILVCARGVCTSLNLFSVSEALSRVCALRLQSTG